MWPVPPLNQECTGAAPPFASMAFLQTYGCKMKIQELSGKKFWFSPDYPAV
jgi:hypothetical protein